MVRIGGDRTERLDIVPAQLRVIVTVRPKYACRACEEGVTQAPAPARLIEGALPTEGLLAHVLVSKYADHLPLYRQSQIRAGSGIDLHRSTLADWVYQGSLPPARGRLPGVAGTEEVGEAPMDETTAGSRTGPGQDQDGIHVDDGSRRRPWCGADPPGVVYRHARPRGAWRKLLEGFSGTLQTDGYSGYNRLRRSDRPDGALTPRPVGKCPTRPEGDVRQQRLADREGRSGTDRRSMRSRRRSGANRRRRGRRSAGRNRRRRERRGVWLDEQRSRVSPARGLVRSSTYIANQWGGLLVFLYDGRVNRLELRRDFDNLPDMGALPVRQPSCFIAGSNDVVRRFVPNVDPYADVASHCELRFSEIIEGPGHWVQQEAPGEVTQALLRFLSEVG